MSQLAHISTEGVDHVLDLPARLCSSTGPQQAQEKGGVLGLTAPADAVCILTRLPAADTFRF